MKTTCAFFALLLLFALVACDDKNYYDPDNQKIPDNLSNLNVPTGFDWTTSSQFEINLDIDDQYNNSRYYKVQVFDKNPIISTDALLLAEGLAKGSEPFRSKVTYAKSDSILYIQETSPSGKRSIRSIYTSNGEKSANLSVVKASETQKGNTKLDYTVPTRTYNTPSNAVPLTGKSTLEVNADGLSYVIPAGQTFEGAIDNGSFHNIFVYVEGTWKNPSVQTSLNKMKLIIQDGGKYIPTPEVSSILANGESKIVVASTGSFNPDKKTINISVNNETSQIINNSSVFNVNNISGIKEIYNYGTIVVSGTISSNSENVKIVNEASFTVQNLSLNGNNQIINTCKFIVNETAEFKADIKLDNASEKLFRSKNLIIGGNNTITLASRSILDITNNIQFIGYGSKIVGPQSGEKALLRLEKMTVESWRNPSFTGYLQIESSNYSINEESTKYSLPQDSKYVDFVRKGESTVNIASTECNDGGNVLNNTDPSNQNYPLDVALGTTYIYAFEDNYPNIGDYDMNDVVLDISLGYTMPAANKVSKLTIQSKIRSVGATKRLAAAIQLDGIIKNNIKSVTSTNTLFKGDIFTINNGLETNQDYAVLPITDDVHSLFGKTTSEVVNTKAEDSYISAKVITFTIEFNQPIDISTISLIDMLNVFIINGGYSSSNRMEVHLRGYHPTKKSSDISSGKNYSTSDFVYAIRVPKSFKYPLEWVSIMDAYPQFNEWVSSNGSSKPDWYMTSDNQKVYLLEK